jgi:lipid A oxidase
MAHMIRRVCGFGLVCALLLLASPASAQWYAGVYMGANTTRPADVTVKGDGYNITIPKVSFEAQPFTSPQYYGWRVGRFFSDTRRIGAEVEFIHLKVIGNPTQLRPSVQRYQMTHGLNYLVANLVSRVPFGRSAYGDAPFALISRIGAGATLPHAETTIFGAAQEQYEYAGLGAHAAIGIDVRLKGRLSLLSEYKLTYARPTISTANNGTGRTTTLSHHVAVGLAFGLSR